MWEIQNTCRGRSRTTREDDWEKYYGFGTRNKADIIIVDRQLKQGIAIIEALQLQSRPRQCLV